MNAQASLKCHGILLIVIFQFFQMEFARKCQKSCVDNEFQAALVSLIIVNTDRWLGQTLAPCGPFSVCGLTFYAPGLVGRGGLKGHSHAISVHYRNQKYVLTSMNAHK